MPLEETEFYKSLTEKRQREVMDALQRWSHASDMDETESVIRIYSEKYKREDERRYAEWQKWRSIQIITYNVLDHPNDDPEGYRNAMKKPIKADL